jgi:hypothetical protein
MKSIRALSVVACLAGIQLVAGCIGFAPVPVVNSDYGRPVRRVDVQFIRPGQTTRLEVKTHLGTNYASLPFERAIAYSWETAGLTFDWYFIAYGPDAGYHEKTGKTGSTWHAFFVAFDTNGIVCATRFKPLGERPLQEQLERWANRLP